jgi:aminoglycoside phosphotransferase (APT) family kinase protein
MSKLGPRIGVGRTAEVFGLGDDRVVKLFYRDFPRTSVQTEARAGELVAKVGLPAPDFHGLVEIEDRAGIVYERLEGETMLDAMRRRPHELRRLSRQFAALHRQLHQWEIPELRSYRGSLTDQIQIAPGLADVEKERLVSRLLRLPQGRQMVCHGDFHPDNIMLTRRGWVVIDWMTARCGEPAADVARTLLLLTIGTPVKMNLWERIMTVMGRGLFCRRYQAQYFRSCELTLQQVQSWLPVMAAARLAEGIDDETDHLLTLARTAMES